MREMEYRDDPDSSCKAVSLGFTAADSDSAQGELADSRSDGGARAAAEPSSLSDGGTAAEAYRRALLNPLFQRHVP